jgi:hypothetical protein
MIVRSVDINNDWLFGRGKNDYKSNLDALSQTVKSRLQCFIADCFFDLNAGIDWFNLLGSKNQLALNLAISSTILNTDSIRQLKQLSLNLNTDRSLSISYEAKSDLGSVSDNLNIGV